MTSVLINLFIFVFIFVSNSKTWVAHGQPQVPCYFIFGDSVADPGNNNRLRTDAKANYPPYGIDFPQGVATGRFSNGLNVVDVVGQLLGFLDLIPSYDNATQRNDILQGVNYASGAAGIRAETGRNQGGRFSMDAQLLRHRLVVLRLMSLRGRNAALEYLNKCIYTVGMGSNDYINNYLMPQFYLSSRLFTPERYAQLLILDYTRQLKSLYDVGARKVALIGVGQLGFTPVELAMHNGTTPPTPTDINNFVQLFNNKLKLLVDNFNANLNNAKFTFINSTAITTTLTPRTPALTVLTLPCCIVGANNFTCEPNTIPCANRNQYAFYDNIHPSEIVNIYLANEYYNSSFPSFAQPYDLATLARL